MKKILFSVIILLLAVVCIQAESKYGVDVRYKWQQGTGTEVTVYQDTLHHMIFCKSMFGSGSVALSCVQIN